MTKIGYFTGRPIPRPLSTVRVTITAPDGAILRALDVTLHEDECHQVASALAELISEYVTAPEECRDVTTRAALEASVDETDFPEHERYEEDR